LKIFTSCQPEETARDFSLSTKLTVSEKCFRFPASQELSPTQTGFGKNFTKLLCFKNIDEKCQLAELTHKWTWQDYVRSQRTAPDYVFMVRGTDADDDVWYYVLINENKM